jgi:hypothetical protein
MFESQDKKDLNKKYNKMTSMANQNKFKFAKAGTDVKTQDSVYGELKLSEKLA